MKNNKELQRTYPWWNRPLWGEQSFLDWLRSKSSTMIREEVPDATISLYKHNHSQLKTIGAMAKAIDNEKFNSREFVNFLMMNRDFEQENGVFEGLKNSIELLRVALETKESFLKIEATEVRYRSFSQQEFYTYVFELLSKNLSVEEFKKAVDRKLNDIIPQIKSEEGKIAIQSYVNELDLISKDILGLKLLLLFKEYELSNFALLRTVGEVADSFYDKDLDNFKEFRVIVQLNAEIFLKLGKIIQVPDRKNEPETYAIILQYIALRNRHGKSFGQFQQLLGLLRQWENFYNPLMTIVQEYPPEEYKQPPIFQETIPGVEVYSKYEAHV